MKLRYVLLAIVAIVAVNTMSFQDEVQQQSEYCQNVRDGIWPDYQQTFESECK